MSNGRTAAMYGFALGRASNAERLRPISVGLLNSFMERLTPAHTGGSSLGKSCSPRHLLRDMVPKSPSSLARAELRSGLPRMLECRSQKTRRQWRKGRTGELECQSGRQLVRAVDRLPGSLPKWQATLNYDACQKPRKSLTARRDCGFAKRRLVANTRKALRTPADEFVERFDGNRCGRAPEASTTTRSRANERNVSCRFRRFATSTPLISRSFSATKSRLTRKTNPGCVRSRDNANAAPPVTNGTSRPVPVSAVSTLAVTRTRGQSSSSTRRVASGSDSSTAATRGDASA